MEERSLYQAGHTATLMQEGKYTLTIRSTGSCLAERQNTRMHQCKIGDDCYVGSHSVIVKVVIIGEHSVVGLLVRQPRHCSYTAAFGDALPYIRPGRVGPEGSVNIKQLKCLIVGRF